jgi:uncharacterized membrane protein
MTEPYDDVFEVAPGPLAMFRKIPAQVRWWVYSVAATVFAIEGVLDAAEAGLIPERTQGILLGLFGLFGFTTAVANTRS